MLNNFNDLRDQLNNAIANHLRTIYSIDEQRIRSILHIETLNAYAYNDVMKFKDGVWFNMQQLFAEADRAGALQQFEILLRREIAGYHTAQLAQLREQAKKVAQTNAKFNELQDLMLYNFVNGESIKKVLINVRSVYANAVAGCSPEELGQAEFKQQAAQFHTLLQKMSHKYDNLAALPPQLRATRDAAPAAAEDTAEGAANPGPSLNEVINNIVATKAADGWKVAKADPTNNSYQVTTTTDGKGFSVEGTYSNFNLIPTDNTTYADTVEFADLMKQQDPSFEFTIDGGDEDKRWELFTHATSHNIFIKNFDVTIYEGKEEYKDVYANFASKYNELKVAFETEKKAHAESKHKAEVPTMPAEGDAAKDEADAAPKPAPAAAAKEEEKENKRPKWTKGDGQKRKAMQREAEKRRQNMPKKERKQYSKFTDVDSKKKLREFLNETEDRPSLKV